MPTPIQELSTVAGLSRSTRIDQGGIEIAVIAEADTVEVAISHTDRPVRRSVAIDKITGLFLEGLGRLGPRTYSIVDLSVRQGLNNAEVGAVLGIREDLAATAVARTKERVEHALAIYVLVKTRADVCAGLRRVVGAHAVVDLQTDLAEVVDGHLELCSDCADAWGRIPSPLEVLGRDPVSIPTTAFQDRLFARLRGSRSSLSSALGTRRIHAVAVAAVLTLAVGAVVVLNRDDANATDGGPPVEVLASHIEHSAQARPADMAAQPVLNTSRTQAPATTIAGVSEAISAPTTTLIPSEAPLVTIIAPFNGQRFDSSFGLDRIDLVAVVQDDVDEVLTVEWHEESTFLGRGYAIGVSPGVGCSGTSTYNVTATVTDSSGNTSGDMVTFTVRCKSS